MKLKHWLMGGTMLAATMPLGTLNGMSSLISVAHADVYHVVEPGETLASIAARYHTEVAVLRLANKMSETRDDAALPAMLLRVPEGDSKKVTLSSPSSPGVPSNTLAVAPTTSGANAGVGMTGMTSTPSSPASNGASKGFGAITKSMRYQVQPGDTMENIAARYSQAGYAVTAATLRRRNAVAEPLAPGVMLSIPLSTETIGAAPSATTSTTVPEADMVSQAKPPVYDPPTSSFNPAFNQTSPLTSSAGSGFQNPSSSTRPQPRVERGPASLGSRSYSPTSDGARVLRQNEDAPNAAAPPVSQSRVIHPVDSNSSSKLAQVAQIAQTGARIRRLPQSDAVTLYSCPPGTELAITKQSGPWSAILMSDRSTGWIPTRFLKFTGVTVDITSQVQPDPSWTARNNNAVYNGNYNGDNPMVREALKWLGTPYVYGGEGRNGIDCSSLVQHAFAACGYRLPRTAAEQCRVGQAVDPSNLQAGDRLYFSASGTRVDHTGLYMGGGLFVQASGSGHRVMVSNLFDRRNWSIFVAARR